MPHHSLFGFQDLDYNTETQNLGGEDRGGRKLERRRKVVVRERKWID